VQKNWKPEFDLPKPLEMGDFIKSKYLKKTTNKNNTMTLQIKSRDSTFALNYISLKHLKKKSSIL
jgi:hypothetical protein